MRTNDTNIDCKAWCYAYYIKDTASGKMWSRNRWGTSTSLPDLYANTRAAQKQCLSGKVSRSTVYGTVPRVFKILLAFEAT